MTELSTDKPKKPNKKIFIAVIFVFAIISMAVKYVSVKSQMAKTNKPAQPFTWEAIVESDRGVLFFDKANFIKIDSNTISYWEKTTLNEPVEVPDEASQDMLIPFEGKLQNIITHYSVDCERHTYQFLNMVMINSEGIERYMNISKNPTVQKPLPNSNEAFSNSYACSQIN